MAEVDILLASYNGEKFIAEQLDSILAQTFKDFRILIRDDGSTDRTVEIIEDYARKYPDVIQVIHDDVICKHPTKNFFELMKHAEADYVMFSDQDDFWLPYKIQITLDYMKKTERENPGLPVCVFTGLHMVDTELKSLDEFLALEIKHKDYDNVKNIIFKNKVSGCAQMINRAVYENIGEYSEHIAFHDHWTALYAIGCGAICHVPMALILYRQHKNNFVSKYFYRTEQHKNRGLVKRIFRAVKRICNIITFTPEKISHSRDLFYKSYRR